MKLSYLKNKKTALWGLGIEGQAILDYWGKYCPSNPFLIIKNDVIPEDIDVIIRSPGVSIYKNQAIEAIEEGIEFTSLMNIFLSEINAQENRPKIIAVTATKGKSTTVSMLAFMLEKLGYKVGLGGNIGFTPLEFLGKDLDFVVLELSSFQISDLKESIDISVIMNLSKAHLDWHLNYENYLKDKVHLANVSKKVIVNKAIADVVASKTAPHDNISYYENEEGFHTKQGKVFDGNEEIVLPKLQVIGEHNLSNICAALSVLETLGLDYKKAAAYLGEFNPLEHRLEKVFENKGRIFVNDSIATVPESVMAAIEAFKDQNVALIIGGYDNGSADYVKLNEFIDNAPQVKVALCLPDTGAFVNTSKSVPVANMREAITEAVKRIDKGVVLLSPAAPSFNMYKNYKERGWDFTKLAKELG